jgi:Zn-finger nucleic acid-binding protein
MIDICPNRKGIWLDCGELAKIIQGLETDKSEDSQRNKDSGRQYVNPEQKNKKTMVEVLADLLLFW